MSAPASWRDPFDWPFLISGAVVLTWFNLWCKLRHHGSTYREEEIDDRTPGLVIRRLLLSRCGECGRVTYRAPDYEENDGVWTQEEVDDIERRARERSEALKPFIE